MQREIKFRAWDKVEKAFVVPLDFCITGMGQLLLTKSNELISFGEFKEIADDRYLVMQYTGLKDKSGREIYEGDIIKFIYKYRILNAEVYFCEILYEWRLKKQFLIGEKITMPFSLLIESDFEIIGNIYENPELLK